MLKDIRTEIGMTQEQAAAYLGISRRTFLKYENNKDLQNSFKGKYMADRLKRANLIDEEHGLLSIGRIKELCSEIFPKYGVEYCYLFGSYARGEERENSDIDLLILMPLDGLKFFELIESLRDSLRKKVDLLDARHIHEDPELLNNILKDGVKIYG